MRPVFCFFSRLEPFLTPTASARASDDLKVFAAAHFEAAYHVNGRALRGSLRESYLTLWPRNVLLLLKLLASRRPNLCTLPQPLFGISAGFHLLLESRSSTPAVAFGVVGLHESLSLLEPSA